MIKVYATTEDGDGYATLLGSYECVEDIQKIRIGMFNDDVVISFEEEFKKEREY